MAVKRGGRRPAILLDWFNVTYRSLAFGATLVLLVVGGAGGYSYYHFVYERSPRARATAAISSAEALIEKASPDVATDEAQDLKQQAQRLLADARRQFDFSNFEDATRSAEQSQMSSQRLLSISRGEAARAAQFYKIEGDVRVKRARELIWGPATKGMALAEGDQIKTDSRSAAQIIYFNGTITTVTPGSILEIKELSENPSTRVQQVRERLREGRIASTMQEANTQGSFHEIATENAVAKTEERASLEVAFDEARKRTELEVHTGRAAVSAGESAPAVAVEAQERVEVDAGARMTDKVRIPPAPLLEEPVDQKIIPLGDATDIPVQLEWQEVPGAVLYHLQISPKSLFSDTIVDQTLETHSATLPAAREGSFYWRVSAIFPDRTEGSAGEVRKFKVVRGTLELTGDDKPPALHIDDFLVFATQVIVRGKTEPGSLLSVNGTKLDVYDDGTFTAVIPLRRAGRQTLAFIAQDIAGNTTRQERVAVVDAY